MFSVFLILSFSRYPGERERAKKGLHFESDNCFFFNTLMFESGVCGTGFPLRQLFTQNPSPLSNVGSAFAPFLPSPVGQ